MDLRNGAALLLAGTMIFCCSGCAKKTRPASGAEKAESSSVSPASAKALPYRMSTETSSRQARVTEQALERLEQEKYSAYTAVNNFMVDRLQRVIESYFSRVAYQEEFSVSGGNYWCISLGESLTKKLETAHALSEKEPDLGRLDDSFQALYPVLKELMGALDQVYEYAELKSYVDDDYALARELHAVIWRTVNQYPALAGAFMGEVEKAADARLEEALEDFEKNGLVAHYSVLATLLKAKEIQKEIVRQGISDTSLTNLDLEPVQPLYDELVVLVGDTLGYIDDEAQLAREGWRSASFSIMEDYIKGTKVALTELMQRVREQRPLQSYELNMARSTRGSVSYFYDQLTGLINQYNYL